MPGSSGELTSAERQLQIGANGMSRPTALLIRVGVNSN